MGWVVKVKPLPLYPREWPGTHCLGGWVGPGAGLGGWGNSRPPPGMKPRTVQSVASNYTDWAIPAHLALRLHTKTTCPLGRIIFILPPGCAVFLYTRRSTLSSASPRTIQTPQSVSLIICSTMSLSAHRTRKPLYDSPMNSHQNYYM